MSRTTRTSMLLCLLLALPLCEAQARGLRIVAGGDVAFGRQTPSGWRPIGGPDVLKPFAPLLHGADLALVNLESPLCEALPPAPAGEVRLRGPEQGAGWLARAGVDAVSLANNHALDCGLDGLRATSSALKRAGVLPVGARSAGSPLEPELLRVEGVDVVLLARTHHRNRGTRTVRPLHPVALRSRALLQQELPQQVVRARSAHPGAPIVVLLHWGGEGASRPTGWQRALGRSLVRSGATAVIGHGAHVPQGAELIEGCAVVWGAGNLVFDMSRPPAARRRVLYEITLSREGEGPWRATRVRAHEMSSPATAPP